MHTIGIATALRSTLNPRVVFFFTALLIISFFSDTYAQATPPRLFVESSTLEEIRQAIRQSGSTHAEAYAELKTRVDSRDWRSYPFGDENEYVGYKMSWLAREAAFLARINTDQSYADLAFEMLEKTYSSENLDGRIPSGSAEQVNGEPGNDYGLSRAMLCFGFAITYDMCYSLWNQQQRDWVRGKLNIALDAWPSYGHANLSAADRASNWVAVCRGGELVAMIGAGQEKERSARYESLINDLLTHTRNAYGSLGASQEGHGYAEYAGEFLLTAARASADIGDSRLMDEINAHAFWKRALYSHTFQGYERKFLMMGVDHSSNPDEGWASLLFTTVPQEKIPAFTWWYDRHIGLQRPDNGGRGRFDADRAGTVWALLYYPVNVQPADPAKEFPIGVEDDHGYGYFRNRWQDENDLLVSLHADAVHHDNAWDRAEAGGLNLMAGNTRFIGASAKDGAAGDFSMLLVDQKVPNDKETGKRILFETDGKKGYTIIDGDRQYKALGLTRYQRHGMVDFDVDGADGIVATFDEVRTNTSRMLTYNLNLGDDKSNDDIQVSTGSEGGRQFFVMTGRNNSYVKGWVLHPQDVTITAGDPTRFDIEADSADIWVAMIVGRGAAPEAEISGSALSTKMAVAGKTVYFDKKNRRIKTITGANNYSVSITSPGEDTQIEKGSDITVSATVTGGKGSSVVEFFDNGVMTGEDRSAPYEHTFSSLSGGIHRITVSATDEIGWNVISETRTIAVAENGNVAPHIQLTAPHISDRAIAPAAITLSATAEDFDGSVKSVDFYVNGEKVVSKTDKPYTASYTPKQSQGSLKIYVQAVDNDGARTSSDTLALPLYRSLDISSYTAIDIGQDGGSEQYSDGQFTIAYPHGVVLWFTPIEKFRFIYWPLEGDGEITARVHRLDDCSMGVTIRDRLDSKGPMAAVYRAHKNTMQWRWVTTPDASFFEQTMPKPGGVLPRVRIRRTGQRVSGFVSFDDATWLPMGTATIPLSETAYIGLSACGDLEASEVEVLQTDATTPVDGKIISLNFAADHGYVPNVNGATGLFPSDHWLNIRDESGTIRGIPSETGELFEGITGSYSSHSSTDNQYASLNAETEIFRGKLHGFKNNDPTVTLTGLSAYYSQGYDLYVYIDGPEDVANKGSAYHEIMVNGSTWLVNDPQGHAFSGDWELAEARKSEPQTGFVTRISGLSDDEIELLVRGGAGTDRATLNALQIVPADEPIAIRGARVVQAHRGGARIFKNAAGMPTVQFSVSKTALANLAILDLQGREVYSRSGEITPGSHHSWAIPHSKKIVSGMYFVRFTAGGSARVAKLVQIIQ